MNLKSKNIKKYTNNYVGNPEYCPHSTSRPRQKCTNDTDSCSHSPIPNISNATLLKLRFTNKLKQ